MSKPLTVNAPYPSAEALSPDALSLAIISPAYASSTGELNSILQYVYHGLCFKNQSNKNFAEALQSIASAEMLHFRLLGETIFALGAQPIFCHNPPTAYNFYSAKYVSYSHSLTDMIEDDIIGERRAIFRYTRMLSRLKNAQVKQIVSRIIEDEKLHLSTLKEILHALKC